MSNARADPAAVVVVLDADDRALVLALCDGHVAMLEVRAQQRHALRSVDADQLYRARRLVARLRYPTGAATEEPDA
jgi:hypothetical protein